MPLTFSKRDLLILAAYKYAHELPFFGEGQSVEWALDAIEHLTAAGMYEVRSREGDPVTVLLRCPEFDLLELPNFRLTEEIFNLLLERHIIHPVVRRPS